MGCFSMIRREAFDQVGLLDENLFMYGDDVDWCRRCWNAGWQVMFFPGPGLFMTVERSRQPIRCALLSRSRSRFCTTGVNIMASWVRWPWGALCSSIIYCATRLRWFQNLVEVKEVLKEPRGNRSVAPVFENYSLAHSDLSKGTDRTIE